MFVMNFRVPLYNSLQRQNLKKLQIFLTLELSELLEYFSFELNLWFWTVNSFLNLELSCLYIVTS